MKTIIGQLKVAAEKYNDLTYLGDKEDSGWVSVSYMEAYLRSRYLSASLNKLNIKKGNNLAILSEGTSKWVISEFATLFNGAASVPLSVKLLQEELPFRLNHSDSKGIFVSKNHVQKIINIYDQLETENFLIIYLDRDIEEVKSLAAEKQIPGERILSYFDLLEQGESIFEENRSLMDEIEASVDPEDTVTISYTSGTTGNPKGIMLNHRNYVSNSKGGVDHFKIPDGYKSLIILPIDHCFAHTTVIFGALYMHMELYFLDNRGGAMNALKNIPINLQEIKPDFLLTVPALSGNLMKKMIDGVTAKGGIIKKLFDAGLKAGIKINGNAYKKASFLSSIFDYPVYFLAKKLIFSKLQDVFGGNLKFMVGGGALLDIKQQQFFYAIGAPVFQGYGLTEATPVISSNTIAVHKLGSSGKVIGNVECTIRKENGEICAVGEKGEIVIRGGNVMKGYFKNQEATDESIRGEWLWTGDLGYMDEDNFLVVTGREKALLISEDGEKYSPEEIEEGLVYLSPLLSQSMVHNDHRRFTSAVITLEELNVKSYIKDHSVKNAEALLEIIDREVKAFKTDKVYKEKFPSKWMPSTYFIAPEIFSEENKQVNSTMKMVRYKIEEAYKEEIDEMYAQNGQELNRKRNIETLNKMFFQ